VKKALPVLAKRLGRVTICIRAEVFFDTNVLVYAASGTGKDERKKEHAAELIKTKSFVTSPQVLQEFCVYRGAEGSSAELAAEVLGAGTVYSEGPT
jgi:predicted nucleic acid-binding protein